MLDVLSRLRDIANCPKSLIASAIARLAGLCIILSLLAVLSFPVRALATDSQTEVRAGHTDSVLAIAYAPDGKTFATASQDHTIKIWNAERNTEIRTLSGHREAVLSIAYSADGEYLASASADQTAKIWETRTGALVRTIPGNAKEFTSVWFMPDGKTLATNGIGVLRLWSFPEVKQLRSFQIPESLTWSLRASHDGNFLAWGGKGAAYVMDVRSGRIAWTFPTKTEYCMSVAFSPDGHSLAIPVAKSRIELHDLGSGALVRTLQPPSSDDFVAAMGVAPRAYQGLSISPDGRTLAASGEEVRQWDLRTGELISESKPDVFPMIKVEYSPDGSRLAMGGLKGIVGTQGTAKADSTPAPPEGSFAARARATREALRPLERFHQDAADPERFHKADGSPVQPLTAAFSPDGKSMISVGMGTDILFWNLTNGAISARVSSPAAGPGFARLSADGKRLVVAGVEGVAVLDAATHKVVHRYASTALNGQMSPDGHYLGAFFPDGLGLLFDLTRDTGESRIVRPDKQPITAMAFSGDNKSFATGGTGNSIVISMLGGARTQIVTMNSNWTSALAYSRDGRLLAAAANDGSIFLWNLAGGGTRSTLRKPGGKVYSLAFTPDGQTLASVEDGGPIVFRSVRDGHEAGRFSGGDGRVGGLTFSPDGTRFLTIGANSITVWNASGKPLASLYSFEDGSSVAMTPEGYYDASSESAEENVSVRLNGALFPISAYREKFFRPDLVRLALQGRSLDQFGRLDQVKIAPVVAFQRMPAVTSSEQVEVKLKLTDMGGGIGRVRVFVNGTAVLEDELEARDMPGGGVKTIERSYSVRLPAGKSQLEVIGFNAGNSMQSRPDTFDITYEEPAAASPQPALYAVVLGIQKFKNPRFDLRNSQADANLFASTLERNAGGLYSKVTVKTLTSPEETSRDGVIAALNAAHDAVGPNDLFVFFVSSHGISDDGEYFLITSNVGSPSTERLRIDALDKETLTKLLVNISSAKKMVVIDTCQAGALGDPLAAALLTRGMGDITAMKILSRAVGSTVLAATNSDQEAFEDYHGHGLFSYVVAQGLSGKADIDHDGYVSTLELANYVEAEVPPLAEEAFKHAQYPTVAKTGQTFPVAKLH